jgi:hypothetical protein
MGMSVRQVNTSYPLPSHHSFALGNPSRPCGDVHMYSYLNEAHQPLKRVLHEKENRLNFCYLP